ncbi:hypothetical protein PSTT_09728 [Puccinia striiformis]|uniref:Uncharacterized protein n=1 Tax=Puccinia striiformis TaxID=27350 RepID=A0A2S4V797_9BASI|nr:hypothetical protein PSTT_09728 [Puccinia striiformis]
MEAVFLGLLYGLLDTFVRFIHANIPPFRSRWSVAKMPDLSVWHQEQNPGESSDPKDQTTCPDAQLDFIHFDLTILSSAKTAAENFTSRESRLDILINNAGIIGDTRYELSPDGIELTACNATGHFALTSHLLPILKKTASSVSDPHVRIVNVASLAHLFATNPDLSSLEGINRRDDRPMRRYDHSKLNNVLFTNELQKRLSDTSIYCLSVHPGLVASDIFNGIMSDFLTNWFTKFGSYIIASPHEGALTQLYAATSPDIEIKGLRAAYLVPYGQVGRKSLLAQDRDGKLGQQFWNFVNV